MPIHLGLYKKNLSDQKHSLIEKSIANLIQNYLYIFY